MKNDLNFIYELGTLRFIQRTWEQFLGPNYANLAEHIFRVTWIAIMLAQHEKVKNTEKVVKMALVHDIVESRTGDVNYLSRQYVKRDEKKAIEDMMSDTSLGKEFVALWIEYEQRDSIEAKIVKDADNLDVDIEMRERAAAGQQHHKKWHQIRRHVAVTKLYTKSAKKLWKQLQTSDVHEWHVSSNNRFNSGDWKK